MRILVHGTKSPGRQQNAARLGSFRSLDTLEDMSRTEHTIVLREPLYFHTIHDRMHRCTQMHIYFNYRHHLGSQGKCRSTPDTFPSTSWSSHLGKLVVSKVPGNGQDLEVIYAFFFSDFRDKLCRLFLSLGV